MIQPKSLLLLIVAVLINYGCMKEPSVSVNGHWHIISTKGYPNELATLDINDTISIWEKVRYEDSMKSIVDTERKIIARPPMEIYTEYQYKLKNDTLVLEEKNGETILFGIKKNNCGLETDYFASFMLDISLPIIKNTPINQKDISWMSFQLLIGNPKEIIRNIYGDSTRLETYNGFIKLEELKLFNMKHDIKLSKQQQDKISTLIFADKNVMMKELKAVIAQQKSINNRRIFLVGKREKNSTLKKDFTFMPIEQEVVFKENENLESWLNKKRRVERK